MLAPICLFTYNRLAETRQTIEALQKNFLVNESDLIIFSDGGKDDVSRVKVEKVRQFIRSVSGFKSIQIIESPVNKGLANSVISGVTQIIEHYGKVIVLEDDLITSRNFLDYMNQCLEAYEANGKVFSVSGYSYPLKLATDYSYDATFGYRSYSWGWATWQDRWEKVDWEVSDYKDFSRSWKAKLKFNKGGSDLSRMLRHQMEGKLDSWYIRWVYHQYKLNLYDVFPRISKVNNIGFTRTATHTVCSPLRYLTPLDNFGNRIFKLPEQIEINKDISTQLKNKFSIYRRIKYRLLDSFGISNFLIRKRHISLHQLSKEPIKLKSTNKKVPVLFVIFNRPDTTEKVFSVIKQYQPEKLYIASDGSRNSKPHEKEIVEHTRQLVLDGIDWECEVKTLFRKTNVGCGYGVSGAISWFFEQEEQGIILEDDCYASPSFFLYCEELLIKYSHHDQIKMIGGNNFQKGNQRGEGSYYFSHYPTTWGWATWRRAWTLFNSDASNATADIKSGKLDHVLRSPQEKKYWVRSLRIADNNKNKIWDYQFYYEIWINKGICITPNKNLVVNLGFFDNGTHYFLKDSTKLNVKCENLDFPLVHPQNRIVNKIADKFTFDNFYSHSFRRGFRLLFENNIISIIRYFKNRFQGY
jgi:GT2 family glycosyltransferase